ncbi:hypothetical protein AKJ09_06520 [Labilithrix luteola]|uniref:Uncharacterized protein n=1 Tax=Labilithrix luteola TaxID=1391654 RepID=A0A0K1Q2I8_9BACT|nr:hypothetical protein AKJ09_06520 [Labilithrix luteola]
MLGARRNRRLLVQDRPAAGKRRRIRGRAQRRGRRGSGRNGRRISGRRRRHVRARRAKVDERQH